MILPPLPTDFKGLRNRTLHVCDYAQPKPDPSYCVYLVTIRRGQYQEDAEYHGQDTEQDQQDPIDFCTIHLFLLLYIFEIRKHGRHHAEEKPFADIDIPRACDIPDSVSDKHHQGEDDAVEQ